jgi:DMSO reductase anchor subunit
MHPALSVIFFTVVSGAGYGLLILVGILLGDKTQVIGRDETLAALLLGAVFAAAGLISSMFHLGQPQRAWRALSQWRSSWLSREGVAALATFLPLVALGWLLWRNANAPAWHVLGKLLAVLAVATLYCTSGIYTSLKTIHAWHNRYVLPVFLLLGVLNGSAWLWLLDATGGGHLAERTSIALPALTLLLALVCAALKHAYWRFVDTTRHAATPESATGLGRFGTVSSAETPHTEENYLTREMGFALARKHAARLRRIALLLFSVAPAALALIALAADTALVDALCAIAAAACVTAGTFVERWLFFAEAKHVVMLYYRDSSSAAP